MLMGAAVDATTGGPLGASLTQIFGAGLGGAVILVLTYLQYRSKGKGVDGSQQAAAVGIIESSRQDASTARADAAAARAEVGAVRQELVERDRLARVHEAYDRRLLDMLNRAGLLTEDLGVPPPLAPTMERGD